MNNSPAQNDEVEVYDEAVHEYVSVIVDIASSSGEQQKYGKEAKFITL